MYRRNVVKAAAVGIPATSFGFSNQETGDGPLVDEKHDREDPISPSDVERLQREAASHRRDRINIESPIGICAFDPPSDLGIYVLVYHVDGAGRSYFHIGGVRDNPIQDIIEEVPRTDRRVAFPQVEQERTTTEAEKTTTAGEAVTTKAEELPTIEEPDAGFIEERQINRLYDDRVERLAEFGKSRVQLLEESIRATSPRSNQPVRPGGDPAYVIGGTIDIDNVPYGRAIGTIDVFAAEDITRSEEFVLQQTLNLYPGVNEYEYEHPLLRPLVGTIGHIKSAGITHDWESIDGDFTMTDHQPFGAIDGEQTVGLSIGTGGIGLNWSYTQPDVERADRSNSTTARWRWKWPTKSGNSTVFKVASTAVSTSRVRRGDRLGTVDSAVTFDRFVGGRAAVSQFLDFV